MTYFPFDDDERACRVCRCVENRACVDPKHGPCWWVEDDLCSHCLFKARRWRDRLIGAGVLAVTLLILAAIYFGTHFG